MPNCACSENAERRSARRPTRFPRSSIRMTRNPIPPAPQPFCPNAANTAENRMKSMKRLKRCTPTCPSWSCSPAIHGMDGNSGEIRCPRDGFFCWSWSLSRTSDFKFLQDIFGLLGGSFSLYFLEECVFNQLIANCIKLKPERIDKNSFVKKRKRIIGVFIHIVDFR